MIRNIDSELLAEDQIIEKVLQQQREINYDTEFVHAKDFLQKCSTYSGDNLYDHLTDVLDKILAERPKNVIDFFEDYSRKVKEYRYRSVTDHFEDIFVPSGRYSLAAKILPFLQPEMPEDPSTLDPEDLEIADLSKNNMMELLYYFEQVGVGLPRIEMFILTASMRKLVRFEPLQSIKFWGKIYGLQKNYLILEGELKEEELARLNEELVEGEEAVEQDEGQLDNTEKALDDIAKDQMDGEEEAPSPPRLWTSLPPLPVITYTPPPEPPSELPGVGLNKKVYYVANEIGDPWVRLPDVTPKQIRVARKICLGFTGNLDQKIEVYPEFPGTEINYLRAQIARISAGTHIAPLGFYTFGDEEIGEEEEMEEEAPGPVGDRTEFHENLKYDPVPLKDLTDKSMLFWVHCSPYILPQGRTTWWNPNPVVEELGEGGEELGEEEEEEKPKLPLGMEPETGPPLLTPCSEDVSVIKGMTTWSIRISSQVFEEYAIAIIRSNLWPGAYSFATQGKLFQNVYFGNGIKFATSNFSPDPLPPIEQEYPIGPEVMEITDPTGAEEEEWRIAHLPKPIPQILGGEGEEAAEEEEEEDED